MEGKKEIATFSFWMALHFFIMTVTVLQAVKGISAGIIKIPCLSAIFILSTKINENLRELSQP